MPQGSDTHQLKMLEEKKQRWSHSSQEHKLDLILDRLERLEKRVLDLTYALQGKEQGFRR